MGIIPLKGYWAIWTKGKKKEYDHTFRPGNAVLGIQSKEMTQQKKINHLHKDNYSYVTHNSGIKLETTAEQLKESTIIRPNIS